MEIKLQNIVFPNDEKFQFHWGLFYKGDRSCLDRENQILRIGQYQTCDFVTYLNGFSLAKWKTYTNIKKVKLQLEVEGDFAITLLGYHLDVYSPDRKEFSTTEYHTNGKETIELEFPDSDETIIGFEVTTLGATIIYGGAYWAEYSEEDRREVVLSIATTTCCKEDFITRNVNLIRKFLFNEEDTDVTEHIFLNIIDNGRTLDPEEFSGPNIKVFPNLNTGGSGGYARGMIESLHQTPVATHVLLMDDDVAVLPDSIRRTYILLTFLKPEYQQHFISGAMFLYEEMNVQYEDIGKVIGGGDLGPLKPRFYQHSLYDNLANEGEFPEKKNEYAAWWFCCIPVTQIKKNGFPMPFFIRCDDVEYSLRCKAKIITMNGICIWHMGFTNKYNAAYDLYQRFRNFMIAQSASGILKDENIFGLWKESFWKEVYRLNYDAAELLLLALEDYMKGPEFIAQNKGEEIVKANSKKNEKMMPVEKCEVKDIDYWNLYNDWPRKFLEKCLFYITANGHRFWPKKLLKRKPAIIPFDYGIVIQKETLRRRVISVNPHLKLFAMRTMDRNRYSEIVKRYRSDMIHYKKEHIKIEEAYRKKAGYLVSEKFWRKYLHLPCQN